MGGSYADPTLSEEQLDAVTSLTRQVRQIMQPGDQVTRGTLTQSIDYMFGHGSVPNVSGVAWDYGSASGRRIDGIERIGRTPTFMKTLSGAGNTAGANFNSQTSQMVRRLQNNLTIRVINFVTTPGNVPGCRYRFRGNIRRIIRFW